MPVADLLVLTCLSGVLALSGIAKLRAPEETQDAFVSLRVPTWIPTRPAAAALPWLELALALGLVGAPAGLLVLVASVTTMLLAAYTLLITRALGFAEPVTCACFGRLGGHRVDRLTLARNVLLLALAGWAVTIGAEGRSFLGAVDSADAGEWAAVAAALLVLAATALIAAGGGPTGPYDEGDLDYLRAPIPFGRLELADGGVETLRGLASTQARLLVFLSPGCGSCVRVAALVDDWTRRAAPALGVQAVYPDGTEQHLDHDPALVAFDPEDNVRSVFGIEGTPAAVLLGADGLMAGGPVVGKGSIARLVEDVLGELEAAEQRAPDSHEEQTP